MQGLTLTYSRNLMSREFVSKTSLEVSSLGKSLSLQATYFDVNKCKYIHSNKHLYKYKITTTANMMIHLLVHFLQACLELCLPFSPSKLSSFLCGCLGLVFLNFLPHISFYLTFVVVVGKKGYVICEIKVVKMGKGCLLYAIMFLGSRCFHDPVDG